MREPKLLKRFQKVLKNLPKILEGIYYKYFPNSYVEKIARDRNKICVTNKCDYYDVAGESSKCFVKGSPCCRACGCSLELKQRSLSSECGLSEIGKQPLWKAVMNGEEEIAYRDKNKLSI